MDNNNWRPTQGEPGMDTGDWRSQLQPDSRQRIVSKIMETLKKNLPISGPEGIQELREIAIRFEEKIYAAAASQQDYLRKISLKILTMETKSQTPGVPCSLPSNPAGANQNLPDPELNLLITKREPSMDTSDWRSQLQPDSRQRIVNKIMETSKKNLPISGPEGIQELREIVRRFEEKVYAAAASQQDYLRKISLKVLTMETKSQTPGVPCSLPSNPAGANQNLPDPELNLLITKREPSMDTSDWRSQIQPDSRQRIVNKMMETLKNLPISGSEGLQELRKFAIRFEEKIYASATSQQDYLRKISLKMLTMETKSQTRGVPGSLPSNPAGGNQNLPDPGMI